MTKSERLIYTPLFKSLLGDEKLVFLDAGARNNLPDSWKKLESLGVLKTIGFEPDIEEYERLNAERNPGRIYYQKAVWNCDGTVGIHIANDPGCSSIYPPNQELLRAYDNGCWEPRITNEYVTVESARIDLSLLALA